MSIFSMFSNIFYFIYNMGTEISIFLAVYPKGKENYTNKSKR